jgi:hypothetical protein
VRRGTAITLVILFLLLAIAAAAQLRQSAPPIPYRGPVSGTDLPRTGTTSTPTG